MESMEYFVTKWNTLSTIELGIFESMNHFTLLHRQKCKIKKGNIVDTKTAAEKNSSFLVKLAILLF